MQKQLKWYLLVVALTFGLATILMFAYQRLAYAQGSVETARVSDTSGQSHPKRTIELDDPQWRQNIPLQAAVSESRAIAIGTPVSNACHQAANGDVTTDYQVRIQEVMKGNLRPDSIVSVSMPGGLVFERDGTLLEARARRIRKMTNGRRYILFLKNGTGPGDSFSPIRGSQGLYEIVPDKERLFHLGRSFEIALADDGPVAVTFIQQIRDLGRGH